MRVALSATRARFALILAVCLATLAATLVMQYVFLWQPCRLCLYERWPYAIAAAISGLMLVTRSPPMSVVGAVVVGCVCVCGVALSIAHIGVERQWWALPVCVGQPPTAMDPSTLVELLKQPTPQGCAERSVRLLHISLSEYSLVIHLVLAAYAVSIVSRLRRSLSTG